jgi:hypothetical protein
VSRSSLEVALGCARTVAPGKAVQEFEGGMAKETKASEPKRQHYIPRFYLKGLSP